MPAPFRDLLPLIARDVTAGFGLLTRIPVPFAAPRPEGVWVWPLVGGLVGSLALSVGAIAQMAGVATGVAAALVLAVQAALTGGLHEDGLADCADGFWGGHDRARRLEIMKDSRIGSYGGLALLLVTLMRWSALAALIGAGGWALALAPMVLSRAAMALVMAALPNARAGGLSDGVGRPPMGIAMAGAALALGLGLLVAGPDVIALALSAAMAVTALAWVARAKIGGQTGDVLGAAQVLAETAGLAVATSFLI